MVPPPYLSLCPKMTPSKKGTASSVSLDPGIKAMQRAELQTPQSQPIMSVRNKPLLDKALRFQGCLLQQHNLAKADCYSSHSGKDEFKGNLPWLKCFFAPVFFSK